MILFIFLYSQVSVFVLFWGKRLEDNLRHDVYLKSTNKNHDSVMISFFVVFCERIVFFTVKFSANF